MPDNYDLAIIGAGAAGLTAAPFAVRLGARVALVEKGRIGGDCTWTGCVPSKTLIRTARLAHQIRHAERYGLNPVEPSLDFTAVMGHVQKVVSDIYQHTSPDALRQKGIDVFLGEPSFQDGHTILVRGDTIAARKTIVCTGAHPFVPDIPGLAAVTYLTYESIWDLESLPRRMIVIGAGPIGCELAQAFCRLGTRVTLIEANQRISDEPEVARVVARVFTQEGIDIRTGAMADRAWQDEQGIHLVAGGDEITGDALLVAVGRRPRVDHLGLEKAKIAYSEKGIRVDDYLRTNQPDVYAAGDCTGGYQFSHYAGWQGVMAVRNALLPGKSRASVSSCPGAPSPIPRWRISV